MKDGPFNVKPAPEETLMGKGKVLVQLKYGKRRDVGVERFYFASVEQVKLDTRVDRKYLPGRVDNDNHFVSFFAKKGLKTIIVFREKMM